MPPLPVLRRWLNPLAASLALALVLRLAAFGQADEPAISFNRDIRPLLSAACFKCHGFDEHARQADLRLDLADSAARVIDGDAPLASELWQRIISSEADLVMPPPDQLRQLTADEKQRIEQWLVSGAAYQGHWSLEPIGQPESPELSAAEYPAWQTHPVDRFLLAAQRRVGLSPQPIADRETLIRRVALRVDWAAAHAGGVGRLSARSVRRCLRADGRTLSEFTALRRRDGAALVGRGPLW